MSDKKKAIFLTRGELHIHAIDRLSVHLKTDDHRWKEISELIGQGELKFVTIDPKLDKCYVGFYKGNWYLIPSLEYTGFTECDGYLHFSFMYTFTSGSYVWQKEGVKMLKYDEINFYKETQTV